MLLLTISKASKLPYAPSRQWLGKLSKDPIEKRPPYFVEDKDRIMINVEHPEWEEFLKKRAEEKPLSAAHLKGIGPGYKPTGSKNEKPESGARLKKAVKDSASVGSKKEQTTGYNPGTGPGAANGHTRSTGNTGGDLTDLIHRANIAQLEDQILKNEGKRYQNEQQKLRLKVAAGDLIEFKLAEFLFFGYLEKLNIELLGLCKKIEPMIDNMVKEQDTKGILKLFDRHFETILEEVKKAQAMDVEEWEEEADRGNRK